MVYFNEIFWTYLPFSSSSNNNNSISSFASFNVWISFLFDLISSLSSSNLLFRRANWLIFCWSSKRIWISLSCNEKIKIIISRFQSTNDQFSPIRIADFKFLTQIIYHIAALVLTMYVPFLRALLWFAVNSRTRGQFGPFLVEILVIEYL